MASVILGNQISDVVQGGQVVLVTRFETFIGSGFNTPASGVTVGITQTGLAGSGTGTLVPTTSAGITTVDSSSYQYVFNCPAATAAGDYLVTWTGVVAGVTQTRQQTLTVAAIASGAPAPGGYATVAQYRAQTQDLNTPDSRVLVNLQRASEDIDLHTIGAVYAVNANGMPTDAMVIDAFMRACCAQCQFLLADNDPTGVKRQYTSTSIGGVSQARAAAVTALPMPPLAPRAASILHVAGVLSAAPLVNW